MTITAEHEFEFERLGEGLSISNVASFIRFFEAKRKRPDGHSQYDHLITTSRLSHHFASRYYPLDLGNERAYFLRVCLIAGMLHESMRFGFGYEDIVNTADEAVANVVSALTPDWREPRAKRLQIYFNRVGVANVNAHLVKLADLRHESRIWSTISSLDRISARIARDWVEEAKELIQVLYHLNETPLTKQLGIIKGELNILDRRCRLFLPRGH